MKAQFKVDDAFRLKKDHTFERTFPLGGYGPGRTVGESDKTHKAAGSVAKVSAVRESTVSTGQASYSLNFDDIEIHLPEKKLLELFDTV